MLIGRTLTPYCSILKSREPYFLLVTDMTNNDSHHHKLLKPFSVSFVDL